MEQQHIELESTIGHHFADPELLRRALTHRSVASEHQQKQLPRVDNEQMEFLGDSVLGFLVSEALLKQNADLPEGHLSKIKSRLVSASHLYYVAISIQLGDALILGRGEELSGGRNKKALLSDALEALIAAIYLDGGIDPARQFVLNHVMAIDSNGDVSSNDDGDAKSALQELTQSLKLPLPRYHVLKESGPDHRKVFTVEVRVGKDYSAIGEDGSKKSASQNAARLVLEKLQELKQNQSLS